ncbi:DUF4089 domain-containing protein [Neokomagataea thailandica]|uniref:DUF4089 domain-containing protein n=1 Tax=Neokomagataea tanensis NBRC 106556 TaxID=1223519 RepID=A0ABQ0QI99_9PROT|nr:MULTISPECIES: DUF4089 domain-containing protein [Neokomagataea]GBR45580.1 hypothetical protein AA106556_0817 [Neokomagataea tanensis NBRC 106556]
MIIHHKDLTLFFQNIGLTVSEQYHDGIMANITILSAYADLIDQFPLSDREEPAAEYEPNHP